MGELSFRNITVASLSYASFSFWWYEYHGKQQTTDYITVNYSHSIKWYRILPEVDRLNRKLGLCEMLVGEGLICGFLILRIEWGVATGAVVLY